MLIDLRGFVTKRRYSIDLPVGPSGGHWGQPPDASSHQVAILQWRALHEGWRHGRPLPASASGVRQGCPLSPTLFGIFFDGLHSHLDSTAPHAGVQLGSGRWVPSLVYADDVVLLSWTSAGAPITSG